MEPWGPFAPEPPAAGTLVAVMAISAFHGAGNRPWRDQAGHVTIFSHGFDGVERLIGDAELQPLVRFRYHAIYPRRAARDTVPVAPETDFVFFAGDFHCHPAGIDAHDSRRCIRQFGLSFGGGFHAVRIVAIRARHMACGRIDDVLGRTVRVAILRDRMDADFLKIGSHVLDSR